MIRFGIAIAYESVLTFDIAILKNNSSHTNSFQTYSGHILVVRRQIVKVAGVPRCQPLNIVVRITNAQMMNLIEMYISFGNES